MPKLDSKYFEVSKCVVAAMDELVLPVLDEVEFYKSPFSAHINGWEGRDHEYTYCCLPEHDILEILRFQTIFRNDSVQVYYYRLKLSESVRDLSDFSGKVGIKLFLPPFSKNRKKIQRMWPIPFLHLPRAYGARWYADPVKMRQEALHKIQRLASDIAYIEITRAEWLRENQPFVVDVSDL